MPGFRRLQTFPEFVSGLFLDLFPGFSLIFYKFFTMKNQFFYEKKSGNLGISSETTIPGISSETTVPGSVE